VTASNVTTPADQTFHQIDVNSPGTLQVAGTFTGLASDDIQIACVASNGVATHLGGPQTVTAGAFNVNVPLVNIGNQPTACAIEALPSGATSGDPPASQTSFTGPRVYFGSREVRATNPSANELAVATQKPGAAWFHFLTGNCALGDAWLVNPTTLQRSESLFFCNAWLDRLNDGSVTPATRSQLVVDGVNAYLPNGADRVNDTAPHLPAATFGDTYNPLNGDLTMNAGEPAVICNNDTSLPTNTTKCADFVSAGVRVDSSIATTGSGATSTIVHKFVSTDGKVHSLDLLWDNETKHAAGNGGVRFPWIDPTYRSYVENATPAPPPAGPGSALVKNDVTAPDGGIAAVQGAVTWAAAPRSIVFRNGTGGPPSTTYSDFELGYRRTVRPGAPAFFGWRFTLGTSQSSVLAAARQAEAAFRPRVAIVAPARGSSTAAGSTTVRGTTSDASGTRPTVAVNGHAATVAANGRWSIGVPLAFGRNVLTAVATNRYGATARATSDVNRTGAVPPFAGAGLVGSHTLRLDRRGRVRTRIRCPGSTRGRCRGKVSLASADAVAARSLRSKLKLGSRSFKAKHGKTVTVRVKIRRPGQRLIRRLGALSAVVTVKSRDAIGRHKTKHGTVALAPHR
jgi:hypothetical protein